MSLSVHDITGTEGSSTEKGVTGIHSGNLNAHVLFLGNLRSLLLSLQTELFRILYSGKSEAYVSEFSLQTSAQSWVICLGALRSYLTHYLQFSALS